MIYVFEGARNSGKTFLSNHIEKEFKIPKFKFDFSVYFNLLGLSSERSKETHLFATGKELMLLQLSRDLGLKDFILDRGIVTVFSWALLEKRATEEEVETQIKMVCNRDLLKETTIVYVEGINPNKENRNKDNWDHLDFNEKERECCDFVINKLQENGFKVFRFKNNFGDRDKENLESFFKQILN
jgi:hypothetical protein